MRKKVLVTICMALFTISCFTGCGKTKKQIIDKKSIINKEANINIDFVNESNNEVIFIDSKEDNNYLINAGDVTNADLLINYLKSKSITHLSGVIITTPNINKYEGIEKLNSQIPIEKIYVSKDSFKLKGFDRLKEIINKNKINLKMVECNDRIISKNLLLEMFSISNGLSDYKDNCMFVKVINKDQSILISEESSDYLKEAMLCKYKTKLKSEGVFIRNKEHMSKKEKIFVKNIDPKYAILSNRENHGNINNETVKFINENKINISRMDTQGTITYNISNNKIIATPTPLNLMPQIKYKPVKEDKSKIYKK